MTQDVDATVPEDLLNTLRRHVNATAAGDNRTVLADFLPDRIGQLVGSAKVPRLERAEIQSVRDLGGGYFDAVTRYFEPNESWLELRSRWVRFTDGTWRTHSVRNVPDTAPWISPTGPAEDGLDTPHWEGLRAGELRLQRCASCAAWVWSPRPMCPHCHGFEMVWEAVDPVGTIYSWTRTWQPFTVEASGHLPYVVVLVELPAADGRRVLGILQHADGITPRIGTRVHGVVEQPPTNDYWPLVRWHVDEEAK
ncbi:zinc ribbon domain-containing protein [Mycobacterium syngnathidarum]